MKDGSVKVMIGGREFWAAPLNFRILIEHEAFFAAIGTGDKKTEDKREVVAIIGASIRRNEPIKDEFLLDELDLRNTGQIFAQVLAAGGMTRTGEAQASDGNGQPTTGAEPPSI